MNVSEVAKAVDLTSREAAEELGMESTGTGFAFKQVDEGQAQEYIAKKSGGEVTKEDEQDAAPAEDADKVVVPKRVRFWSTSLSYFIPEDGARKDIKFRGGAYECYEGSVELEYLRSKHDFLIAQHVYEVIPCGHEDATTNAEFQILLRGLIYTGGTRDTGASRPGRNNVLAILPSYVREKIGSVAKGNVKEVIRIVASNASLRVDQYGDRL